MPDEIPMRRTCGAMEDHRRLVTTDPVYRANRRSIEKFARAYKRGTQSVFRPAVVTIPVVVHVVYHTQDQNISDEQILSQLAVLNEDFRKLNSDVSSVPEPFRALAADTMIEFRLAVRNPDAGPTSGITRTQTQLTTFHSDSNDIKYAATGGHDAWPRDNYLNIWVAPAIVDPQIGGLLGYAQFPGGPAETDGVVIWHASFGTTGTARSPFNKGRTATHEIGHWFDLLHIWGETDLVCGGSDEVEDTPNQEGPNYGTPVFPHVTCNNGPNGDMFMNYMDYTDDAVMGLFTDGQALRMAAALDGPRAALLNSDGLARIGTTVPIALPAHSLDSSAPIPVPETGAPVKAIFDGVTWVPIDGRTTGANVQRTAKKTATRSRRRRSRAK